MEKKYTAIPVRLPPDLYKKVLDLSEINERSLNGQILFMIKDWLDLKRNKSETLPGEDKISSSSSGFGVPRGGKEAKSVISDQ